MSSASLPLFNPVSHLNTHIMIWLTRRIRRRGSRRSQRYAFVLRFLCVSIRLERSDMTDRWKNTWKQKKKMRILRRKSSARDECALRTGISQSFLLLPKGRLLSLLEISSLFVLFSNAYVILLSTGRGRENARSRHLEQKEVLRLPVGFFLNNGAFSM